MGVVISIDLYVQVYSIESLNDIVDSSSSILVVSSCKYRLLDCEWLLGTDDSNSPVADRYSIICAQCLDFLNSFDPFGLDCKPEYLVSHIAEMTPYKFVSSLFKISRNL